MRLELEKYIVNREEDFIEEDIKKVRANLSVIVNIIGNKNNAQFVKEIEVVSLNSASGDDMDDDRLNAINNLLNNF